jgi:DNA ligase-1
MSNNVELTLTEYLTFLSNINERDLFCIPRGDLMIGLKIINYQHEEVYLAGYRKDEYGWLVQVEESGKKRPAGIIKLGGSAKKKKAFYTISKQLIIGEDKKFVYLDPRIKARVKFRNWTRHGMLRGPTLVDFFV